MSWKLQAICQTLINCTIYAEKQIISEISVARRPGSRPFVLPARVTVRHLIRVND